MNYIDRGLSQITRGIYLYKKFLPYPGLVSLVSNTKHLWYLTHKYETKEQAAPFNETKPIYLIDSEQELLGQRWVTENREDYIFNGNKNIPNFVKKILIRDVFNLLAKQSKIPELQTRYKKLRHSQWDLNLVVNLKDPQSSTGREFSCGSLKSDQTALLIYSMGPSSLFYIPEKNKGFGSKAFISIPIAIPPNSLVLVTKRALSNNENFVLPIFRQAMHSPEDNLEDTVSKLIFSFNYKNP